MPTLLWTQMVSRASASNLPLHQPEHCHPEVPLCWLMGTRDGTRCRATKKQTNNTYCLGVTTCIPTYSPTYRPTYRPTDIHTCIHTYNNHDVGMQACMH